jgi:hypothetical protein
MAGSRSGGYLPPASLFGRDNGSFSLCAKGMVASIKCLQWLLFGVLRGFFGFYPGFSTLQLIVSANVIDQTLPYCVNTPLC